LQARRFPRLFGDLCAMARDNGRMEEWKVGRMEEWKLAGAYSA